MGGRGSDGGNARRKPSLPWTVRVQLAALALAHRRDGSVRRLLFSLGDLKSAASSSSSSGVRSADVTIDASKNLWARVFSPSPSPPATADPVPVVVYFHGGGFVLFSASSRPYDAFCRRLCAALGGAVVVSVNYRLAPHHRFPAAYDDGVAALRFLAAGDSLPLPPGVRVDLGSCFLAGDSAGGNIAHHVAQRWAESSSAASSPPPAASASLLRIAGAVLIQPFFGGEERTAAEVNLDGVSALTVAATDHYWREFLPEGATRDHPAARVCGDGVEIAAAFPPAAMVVVGGFDLLKDWQARYVEALRGKGKMVRVVEYPDAVHGFHAFPELDDAGKLVEEMKLFVREHSSTDAKRVPSSQ